MIKKLDVLVNLIKLNHFSSSLSDIIQILITISCRIFAITLIMVII